MNTKKEIVLMGLFSTVIMDIGFVFLKATSIVKGSMEPQFLGRWILNIFNGHFIQENIGMVTPMGLEKPVSLITHYVTGIALVGIFLLFRKKIKTFPGSIYMGFVFSWISLVLPWCILYPSLGFGFMGLNTPEGSSNIVYSIIYHSFFGLGITLWLGIKGKKNATLKSLSQIKEK